MDRLVRGVEEEGEIVVNDIEKKVSRKCGLLRKRGFI